MQVYEVNIFMVFYLMNIFDVVIFAQVNPKENH